VPRSASNLFLLMPLYDHIGVGILRYRPEESFSVRNSSRIFVGSTASFPRMDASKVLQARWGIPLSAIGEIQALGLQSEASFHSFILRMQPA